MNQPNSPHSSTTDTHDIRGADINRQPALRLILDFEVQHLDVIPIHITRLARQRQHSAQPTGILLQLRSLVSRTDLLRIDSLRVYDIRDEVRARVSRRRDSEDRAEGRGRAIERRGPPRRRRRRCLRSCCEQAGKESRSPDKACSRHGGSSVGTYGGLWCTPHCAHPPPTYTCPSAIVELPRSSPQSLAA
jgi:hypothetical protein